MFSNVCEPKPDLRFDSVQEQYDLNHSNTPPLTLLDSWLVPIKFPKRTAVSSGLDEVAIRIGRM
ncbi:hypothetical protein AGR2A_pa30052 [Agrobacterium genomosp. 2 str. CFBP 5494]|uniref:Uncharacterized protein n=1 Tax=Agrobacterium genomosp. 2 str. CFBP 5494 TaxID=1183436 RepID=A0A9W5F2N2_9HYPH|nr:hypothetical protein AGR2A_pa30052 [Agrobacterium genomosp. 2 str. CFBP 5494]